MSALHKLQLDFISAVFDDVDKAFSQTIKADGLTGARRLQVYHNNIFISLTAALEAVYPVIYRLVGEEFFRYMAGEYIHQHPSRSGNLHDFGDKFATFIDNFEPAGTLVYLSDVARLEWAYHVVFHAAECGYLDVTGLHQVKEDQYPDLVFSLNPASQLLASSYPVLAIWQANQEDANNTDAGIDLDAGGSRLLIIRRNRQVEFESLSHGEYEFLHALACGKSFSVACELALQAEPGFSIDHCFQKHVQTKTLIDFSV